MSSSQGLPGPPGEKGENGDVGAMVSFRSFLRLFFPVAAIHIVFTYNPVRWEIVLMALKSWLVAEFGNPTSHLTDAFEVCGRCIDTNTPAGESFVCSVPMQFLSANIYTFFNIDRL